MSKPFKTIDEQIELLKNRNLSFGNEDKSKDYLLKNNYYNIINCYSKFLMDSSDHYSNGSTFEQIIEIHRFDREVKHIALEYMLSIESYVKSIISYHFSKSYKDDYAYLNQNNYDISNLSDVVSNITALNDTLSKYRKKSNNAIQHYSSQHQNVPLWVFANFLTFGQINTIFRLLQPSVKNAIVKEFNRIFNENIECDTEIRLTDANLDTMLDNLKNTRNVLAHNNKLFDFSLRNHYKYLKEIHDPLGIGGLDSRNDFYNTFVIMELFFSDGQYEIFYNSIRKRMKKLEKHCGNTITNKVIMAYGFPQNWFKLPAYSKNKNE